MQKTDDPARNLRNLWLGAGDWRFYFDARYSAWGVWFICSGLFVLLAYLVVPFTLVIAVGVAVLTGWVNRQYRWPARNRWIMFGFLMLCALGLAPGTVANPQPMSLGLALFVGPALALAFTRKVMRHVNPNTPLKYWRHLPMIEATGPRQRQPLAHFHQQDTPTAEPVMLRDMEFVALATAPGGSMGRFVSKAEVEAKRWVPDNEERAGAFLAWLTQYGYQYVVAEGDSGSITIFDPLSMIEVYATGGQWVFFTPKADGDPESALTVLDDADFKEAWEREDGEPVEEANG